MYNAYSIDEVVSKLPIEALSISNHAEKDFLFIGSRPGHLLCCSHITEGNQKHYEYMVSKNFEKRPILELSAVEQHDLIICLTDSTLSIHEGSEPYRLNATIVKYKPVLGFTYHIEQKNLYILISIRNRLAIFKHSNSELEEIINTNLSDTALKIIWSNSNSLFLSMKHEYQFAKISIGRQKNENKSHLINVLEQPKTLFVIGQSTNENPPLLIGLPDKSLVGLCRDDKIVDFVEDYNGQMAQNFNSCRFSDVIYRLAYDPPYLVAILSSHIIEIRSILPSMLIQKISLLKPSMLSIGKSGCVYVASDTQAWKLNARAHLQDNFKQLKNEKQFQLALQLAETYQPLISQNNVIELKKLMAANFFSQRKFSPSFDIHIELNTDVLFVISLFAEFVPEKYEPLTSRFQDDRIKYDLSQKPFNENDRKCAIRALIQYLSMKRNEHSKPISLHFLDYKEGRIEHILSTSDLKRHETTLELINTVLIKCYIEVSPTLVGSLLRSKNCSCIISEAEKDLKQNKMLEELLILYKQKKMYRKFLELLQKEFKKPDTTSRVDKMADFLMELKQDQLPLIVEFSSIVLSENIDLGVKIFTEGEDSKNFDRDSILQFLKREHPTAVTPYLEYIIKNWNDERPKFHEELLLLYTTRIREVIAQYVKSLSINNNQIYAINDSTKDLKTELQKKLRIFLENDKHYTMKDALNLIGSDENLVEERAIIYGRLGQHIDALNIYTNILMDFAAAERHCQKYYSEKDLNTSQIFYNLFHFYITGSIDSSKNSNSLKEQNGAQRRQNITEALKLLRRHPTKINIVSAFELIPSNTALTRICGALSAVFETLNNRLTSINVMLSLTNIAIRRSETHLNLLKQQRVHINERVDCCICKKRIMESAFVRHRDFLISHFFCFKANYEQKKQRMDSPIASH